MTAKETRTTAGDQRISKLMSDMLAKSTELGNPELKSELMELGGFLNGSMYQLPVAKCEELATTTISLTILRSDQLAEGSKAALEEIHACLLRIAILILEGEADAKRAARRASPLTEPPNESAISIMAEEADCHEHISKIAHKLRISGVEIEHTRRAAELWEDLAKIAVWAKLQDKAVLFYRRASEQRINHTVLLRLIDSGEYHRPRMR